MNNLDCHVLARLNSSEYESQIEIASHMNYIWTDLKAGEDFILEITVNDQSCDIENGSVQLYNFEAIEKQVNISDKQSLTLTH